nr:dTDP-4-dehydrorhamnose reductase [uncultured Dongia sp.]
MSIAFRTIAVIGRNGQLARELADLTWPGDIRARFLGRGEINLFDPDAITARLTALQPVAIINTAAHTAVDLAETEPVLAMQLNAEVPATLAATARRIDVPLLHVSTDYVFSGRHNMPYREDDVTAPLSVYGQSKRAGEIAALAAGARVTILRSGGLFGRHGSNFLKTMLAKATAGSGDPVRVVADQISTPTPTAALAATLQQMALDMSAGRVLPTLLHDAGTKPVSWFDFTDAIFAALADVGFGKLPPLVPVGVADYPRPAPRPLYSALDSSLTHSLGYPLLDWQAALPSLVAHLTKERIAA